MKNIKPGHKKSRIPLKVRVGFRATIIIILLTLIVKGIIGVNTWFDTNYFQFNRVLTLIWKPPVEIKERKFEVTEIINIVNQIPNLENLEPIEQYICEKWGVYDCKVALAVTRAESGMREEAFNTYNFNGSLDVGIFQLNSVHFDKPGCSLKEVVDQYKNVDCAYQIYEDQGWSPWVVFNSGSFKDHIE